MQRPDAWVSAPFPCVSFPLSPAVLSLSLEQHHREQGGLLGRPVGSWTAQVVTLKLAFRSKKLIQESDQHLKDVEKILQNDKRYLVLDCVPEERRKLIVSYVDDLDRRGPPPPPTASEPTRRTTK